MNFSRFVKSDGKVDFAAMDDAVAEWHNDKTTTQSLHEFLGLSFEDYAVYVGGEAKFQALLDSRVTP